ncbi:hypothetical protein [Proteus faecis]|uniref:hypothetical protein n=1 Tax=Proteus faecis TaxID=2050967 RepID=UPI0021BA3EA8|nr:hypothetical protein [Proteus faecis]MCT8248198.1 hypothetical protein [Proteus faecis]
MSIIIIIQGCAPRSDKNKTLSPSADTEWVTIGIKLPEGIEALPLNVLYRSDICQRAQYNSAGEKYYIPGFNPKTIALKQQGSSDIYQTKIALNGGGSCQWQLSEVWMEIQPVKSAHFAYKDYEIIPSGWMKFYFDNRNNWNENLIKKFGEIEIKRDIFPEIKTSNIFKENTFTLFDGNNDSWKEFRVYNAISIFFFPIYHKNKTIRYEDSKVDNKNLIVIYPDGSIHEGIADYKKLKNSL